MDRKRSLLCFATVFSYFWWAFYRECQTKPNQTEPIQAIASSVCVFVMADDVTANVIFLSSSFSFLSLIAVDITAGCYLVGWLILFLHSNSYSTFWYKMDLSLCMSLHKITGIVCVCARCLLFGSLHIFFCLSFVDFSLYWCYFLLCIFRSLFYCCCLHYIVIIVFYVPLLMCILCVRVCQCEFVCLYIYFRFVPLSCWKGDFY